MNKLTQNCQTVLNMEAQSIWKILKGLTFQPNMLIVIYLLTYVSIIYLIALKFYVELKSLGGNVQENRNQQLQRVEHLDSVAIWKSLKHLQLQKCSEFSIDLTRV